VISWDAVSWDLDSDVGLSKVRAARSSHAQYPFAIGRCTE